MSANGKNSWLSSPTTVIAIITVLLNGMGFLTVRTFNIRMSLPDNFFEDTPISYLQWGAKSIVVLIVVIIGMTVLFSIIGIILSFFLSQTVFRFKRIRKLQVQLVQRFRKLISDMSSTRLTAILFITALIFFLFYYLTQNPIIQGFIVPPDSQTEFSAPTVFSSMNKPNLDNYVKFSAILIITLGFMFFLGNRTRKRLTNDEVFPHLLTGAIFSLWLMAIAFWVMPYRLINNNEFEEVQYHHKPAYVISEKDSRLFLYVPGKRPFVIEKKDTLLDRNGERYYKNIFDN